MECYEEVVFLISKYIMTKIACSLYFSVDTNHLLCIGDFTLTLTNA